MHTQTLSAFAYTHLWQDANLETVHVKQKVGVVLGVHANESVLPLKSGHGPWQAVLHLPEHCSSQVHVMLRVREYNTQRGPIRSRHFQAQQFRILRISVCFKYQTTMRITEHRFYHPHTGNFNRRIPLRAVAIATGFSSEIFYMNKLEHVRTACIRMARKSRGVHGWWGCRGTFMRRMRASRGQHFLLL